MFSLRKVLFAAKPMPSITAMPAHTRGSLIMMPKYPMRGASIIATANLPKSSIMLEAIGVILSPTP